MSSNRPYLVRALYEWISDNGLTPYLLVDAAFEGVRVPPGAAKDGKVILNIAARAVGQFEIANEYVAFNARFGGVSQAVHVPMGAVPLPIFVGSVSTSQARTGVCKNTWWP